MTSAVVLVDGGFLRTVSRRAGRTYDPDFIEAFSASCVTRDETLVRILYYDCAPYSGIVRKPISGDERRFAGSDSWMNVLASKDLFAVRRGVLKFRGWQPKGRLSQPPVDDDYAPRFEQKGVDMRIGLDVASYAFPRLVERIVLVSNDTDCVPALKLARKHGLQTVVIQPGGKAAAAELRYHADFVRDIAWPLPGA